MRQRRTRKKIYGTGEKPRLSIFRSNQNIYAQLVDDVEAKTIVAVSTIKVKSKERDSKTSRKISEAMHVGENLAKLARKKKIKKVVFDKSGYKYHGRVKAVAEGTRKGGLIF